MSSMKRLILVMLVGLAGCGSAQFDANIEPEMVELRAMFDISMADRGHPEVRGKVVSMELRDYGKGEENTLGMCYYSQEGHRGLAITIARSFWNRATPEARALVFYHEAGHCLLDLDHRTDKIAIMNPSIGYYQMKIWKEDRERMIDELLR